MIPTHIKEKLKNTPEQTLVVGPIVKKLEDFGWSSDQIIFGKNEWKIPKNPSEAGKREKGYSFDFFPIDIAVFDSPSACGDYRHLLFIIECKQPTIDVGLQQLETYLSLEPHVKLGIWANNPDDAATALFVYKNSKGLSLPRKRIINDIPSFGSSISPAASKVTFKDLIVPTKEILYKCFEELLNVVVAQDGSVTRREEQLDQLCNIILLKLDSDKQGKIAPSEEVYFRPFATEAGTCNHIKKKFNEFIEIYPDIFVTQSDKEIRFDNSTVHKLAEHISKYNFIDVGADAVSIAFQVLRSAALKQEEGQYFTPKPVIEAAIKLMDLTLNDIVVDPCCGTGGFLVQTLLEMKERYPGREKEISRWAQLHICGIDKDAIGIKLTKAVMQILGDGSAKCVRGDSVLTNTWASKYPHLLSNSFKDGRFTKILTNPPFGAPLKVKHSDAIKAGLSIANYIDNGKDIELGLAMFNRCHDLLRVGGRMCIVLPETYFFSPSYKYVRDWISTRLRPVCVANVPMDAFQGFCRAKTNLYVFEKISDDTGIANHSVVFMNPSTCGLYKNGSSRYKVTKDGQRTTEIDNELLEIAEDYASGNNENLIRIPLSKTIKNDVLVPQYYDSSLQRPFNNLIKKLKCEAISLGSLCDKEIITISSGHGSPSNDLRNGTIPYIKVSDIRNMRINVNPTNLISRSLAQQFWKTEDGKSNLRPWDLITPNRASSNIGEFSILLPGEEQIVLTKEMFVLRVSNNDDGFSPFYLLWALSLEAVRMQWKRITLMQTNREDVGKRYREILIPYPLSKEWADEVSRPFRNYFSSIAEAKQEFLNEINKDKLSYIASVNCEDE